MKFLDTEDAVTPAPIRPFRLRMARAAVPLLAAAFALPACTDRGVDPGAMGRNNPAQNYGTWRPALNEVPRAISEDDAQIYRRIYAQQQRADWSGANQSIAQLKDRSLVGHVLAARYLSSSYKASYAELRDWMAKYSDHPDADRIARLGHLRLEPWAAMLARGHVAANERCRAWISAWAETEFSSRPS